MEGVRVEYVDDMCTYGVVCSVVCGVWCGVTYHALHQVHVSQ